MEEPNFFLLSFTIAFALALSKFSSSLAFKVLKPFSSFAFIVLKSSLLDFFNSLL
jgi:hypothetical protein